MSDAAAMAERYAESESDAANSPAESIPPGSQLTAAADPAPRPPRTLADYHQHLGRAFNSKIDRLHGATALNQMASEVAHQQASDHLARMQQALDAYLHRDWARVKADVLATHGDSEATRQLLAAARQRLTEQHRALLGALQSRVRQVRTGATPGQRQSSRAEVEGALQSLAREPDSARQYVASSFEPHSRHLHLQDILAHAGRLNAGEQLPPPAPGYWQLHPTPQGFGATNADMLPLGQAYLPTQDGSWALHHRFGDEWRRGLPATYAGDGDAVQYAEDQNDPTEADPNDAPPGPHFEPDEGDADREAIEEVWRRIHEAPQQHYATDLATPPPMAAPTAPAQTATESPGFLNHLANPYFEHIPSPKPPSAPVTTLQTHPYPATVTASWGDMTMPHEQREGLEHLRDFLLQDTPENRSLAARGAAAIREMQERGRLSPETRAGIAQDFTGVTRGILDHRLQNVARQHAINNPHGSTFHIEPEAARGLERAFGQHGSSEAFIRNLLGMGDTGHIGIQQVGNLGGIRLLAKTPDSEQHFTIRTGYDPPIIHADWAQSTRPGLGAGLGSFAKQIQNASAMGVRAITTLGARDDKRGLIGYKVWPKYGFDGPLTPHFRRKVARDLGVQPRTIQELYAIPGGADWWAKHGNSVKLTFDPHPESRSMQLFNAYLAAKKHVMDRIEARKKQMPQYGRFSYAAEMYLKTVSPAVRMHRAWKRNVRYDTGMEAAPANLPPNHQPTMTMEIGTDRRSGSSTSPTTLTSSPVCISASAASCRRRRRSLARFAAASSPSGASTSVWSASVSRTSSNGEFQAALVKSGPSLSQRLNMTAYVIRCSPAGSYLKSFDGKAYSWSGKIADAQRFERAEAVTAAEKLAAAIGANGYPGVRVWIVPAHGGARIGQQFVSA